MSSVPVPHDRRPRRRRAGSTAVAGLLTAGLALLGLAVPGTAAADTRPVPAGQPATVAADALPTVQVDGVVWAQVVVGDTVYAAGRFSTARPAGAAAGTQETVRNNLLAYDIRTGALITSFAPDLNAQAMTVAASPTAPGSTSAATSPAPTARCATAWPPTTPAPGPSCRPSRPA